jgi:hypothetical protein
LRSALVASGTCERFDSTTYRLETPRVPFAPTFLTIATE